MYVYLVIRSSLFSVAVFRSVPKVLAASMSPSAISKNEKLPKTWPRKTTTWFLTGSGSLARGMGGSRLGGKAYSALAGMIDASLRCLG
ncbi:hypothetical protein F5Y19DRAFT_449671 [Xylariaceae sp. FL1651]|nr:hypothetical protein F5Y19DRAFT_449671 [Xylariaceae sp. FL1651]